MKTKLKKLKRVNIKTASRSE